MVHFVPRSCHPKTPFTFTDTTVWTLISLNMYLTLNGITTKAAIAPLVAKQLSLLNLEELHRNRVSVFTDGSSSIDGSTAAFYIPAHSIRKGFYLSHPTLSTAAELGGLYYALEPVRACEPATWVFLTDSRAALLSLKAADSKTANTSHQCVSMDTRPHSYSRK